MKRFSRSTAGKASLFVLCIMSFCIFFGSIVGIAFVADSNLNFYVNTEEQICQQYYDDRYDYLEDANFDGSFYSEEQVAQNFRVACVMIHIAFIFRYWIYVILVLSFIVGLASYIALICAAGRRGGDDELHPGFFYKVPFDVLLFAAICVEGTIMAIGFDVAIYSKMLLAVMALVIIAVSSLTLVLGLSMALASRVKQHLLWKYMLIYHVLHLTVKLLKKCWHLLVRWFIFNISIVRAIPLVYRTVLGFLCLSIVELIFLGIYDFTIDVVFWLFVEKLILFPIVIKVACMLRRLQAGGRALAKGDLDYEIDLKGLKWDFKEHAENLNSIADGMGAAVEEKLKSERMKTELITNVSHDIKTPLTSIINYASLIGQEETENEEIHSYAAVLVRQSERLKRLIEDLVEASKASTGNLEVNLTPCDAQVFLTQAGGEYEEKLAKSNLTLITKQPEKELWIRADGRRMWRIFDNLMNNICKYAQEGTRVYLSLEAVDGNAVFTFKNTSRDALDMSEEELMERFTRGDSSRNTEGNGLGLAIARSMAELQNGGLHLIIDGDLFKAILVFPLLSL